MWSRFWAHLGNQKEAQKEARDEQAKPFLANSLAGANSLEGANSLDGRVAVADLSCVYFNDAASANASDGSTTGESTKKPRKPKGGGESGGGASGDLLKRLK